MNKLTGFSRNRRMFSIFFAIIAALLLSGCWSDAASVPHPISTYGFAQCPQDVNNFYVVGGRDEWNSPLDNFMRYDVSTQIWYRLAPLPIPTIAPAAACYQGHIYVVTYEQHLFVYNIAGETWSEVAPPPRAAWGAAISAWDGILYMVSGSPFEWALPVNTVDRYDIDLNTWQAGAATSIPQATYLPGYTQAGPYLFIVGGYGANSPAQNVSATQRYDMSSDTWEQGPLFSSGRAAFALAATGHFLYAMGGDADGGDFLDETNQLESLDLSLWPGGNWNLSENQDEMMPQALMFNSSGFCSEAVTGSEIWSVGGAYPDWVHLNAVTGNRYFSENYRGLDKYAYKDLPLTTDFDQDLIDRQYIQALGSCLLGAFNFSLAPVSDQSAGLPGETLVYTLTLANTGDIPDAYDIAINANWPTSVSPIGPVWSQQNRQVLVSVDIPIDALPTETDTAVITLTSQGDPSLSISASLVTERFVGLVLEPPEMNASGVPGQYLAYPVTLYNATGQTDSFDLVLGAHTWDTTLSASGIGPLPDAGMATFTVTVQVPTDAAWNLTDTVHITATGQTAPYYTDAVTITSQAYAPPQISVTPPVLEDTLGPGQSLTNVLTISNTGYSSLYFNAGVRITDPILQLHLNEPAGSTTFYDASGHGYHSSCSGSTCPTAGVPGRVGNAVSFDGIDDFIRVPAFSMGGEMTVGAWVYARDVYANFSRVMDFSNGPGADNIFFSWNSTTGGMRWAVRQGSAEMSVDTSEICPENEWIHVAAVVDENGMGFIYWNGILMISGQIHTPNELVRNNQYIARSAWEEYDPYFNGMMDEFVIYDRALSAEEVMLLYTSGLAGSTTWLSIEPISGTVPANSDFPLQITFDSTDFQPNTYTTTLSISSNDPLNPLVQVPVTMTVEPTASAGWVEGIVTDLRTGEPLVAAIIAAGQPYTITSNADTGYYKLWLESGVYTLTTSAPGYVTESASVTITAQQGVTQDFALLLDVPWMEVSPQSLVASQIVGEVTTQTLTISNIGAVPLEFALGEEITGSIVVLHLDEPAGSTSFLDTSGYGNHAHCTGVSCPLAGVDGMIGSSVDYDGVNDHLVIPHSPEFDLIEEQNKITYAAWINIQGWPQGYFPLLDVYRETGDKGWGFEMNESAIDFFTYVGHGPSCNHNLQMNTWNHVAITYDSQVGALSYYVNGEVACDYSFTVDIPDTISDPVYIGYSKSGGEEYSSGLFDEIMVFNRALTPDEILKLYEGNFSIYVNWLSIDPISGTVPINDSAPMHATFNSFGLQPGIYTTTLYISSNDPLNRSAQVPVTMTVEPTASMGWVEGTITDLRTGEPLVAAIIAAGQPYTITSDSETGYYKLWLESGSYTLTASAPGYVTESVSVTIPAQQGVTQDFALLLDAPWMEVSPKSLAASQMVGEVTTQTLTISNVGSVPMEFTAWESVITDPVLVLHLDEPAGATTFYDTSGHGNHGTCTGIACPVSGLPGHLGQTVLFDGVDDQIQSPTNDLPTGNSDRTLAAWAKVDSPIFSEAFVAGYGAFGSYDQAYLILFVIVDTGYSPCFSQWGADIRGEPLQTYGEWHHIAVTNVGDLATLYLDGVQVASGIVSINTAANSSFYMGSFTPAGGGNTRRFDGSVDDVVVYDYALSPEEIMQLYLSGTYAIPDWLSVAPISDTVPTNSAVPVQVAFDSTDLQPGVYTTTLAITSNDPRNPFMPVPISMTVTPPTWYGLLEGTVSTPGYCDRNPGVLAGAQLLIESSTGLTGTLSSDAAGHYAYWLDESGSPYTVTASLPGYTTVVESGVTILGQQNITLDFSLRLLAPCLDLAPQQLPPVTLPMGMSATLPLTLTNTGGGGATFEWAERNQGDIPPVKGADVEVAIPAGPTAAPAGSAIAAGPYTPRPERTYTIQPQAILVNPPQVLLLHADDGDGQYIHDQLLAYGDLAAVDSFNARLATPSLADLLPYEVILTWSNYPYADPQALGDALADYVDAGGYVINLMYALGEHGWELEGRFADEGYTAIQGGLVEYGTECLGSFYDPHPIFAGVNDVCEFYRLSNTSLTPGATALARWEDGELFVATNRDRSVVSITGYVGYYFRWTGQMDLLIHNAILWLTLGEDVPWLEVVPSSGSVPGDDTFQVEAHFDTLHSQPGEYIADLLFFSNDPQLISLHIPVTMTVEPTASAGWVEGIVTDLRTGEPRVASIIAEGQPYTVTSDAETGYYKLWLESGSYTLTASAPGYVTESAGVTITAQQGVTQDFALLLDAPWMEISPQSFTASQTVGEVTTQTLVITNTGSAPLAFTIGEVMGTPVLILHLDEPPGAELFHDASGFSNDGLCSGSVCPTAGVNGIWGHAIHFDGINDRLEIPHNAQFDQIEADDRVTITAWIYIEGWYQGWFPILDQYEASTDGAWVFEIHVDGMGFASSCPVPGRVGEWYHVAVSYDRNIGYTDYYINGEQICHVANTADLPDTSGEPAYIGFGPSGGDEYATGMMDDVYVFPEALAAEDIWLLYQTGYSRAPDWLMITPISGTVLANSSLPVEFIFDAIDLQPGTYTTTLYIASTDPLNPNVPVPVTMTVEPTTSMGWVEGYVTDLRTGEPLEASIIAAGQPYTVTSNADTGYYKFWLEAGDYTLQASAPAYVTESVSVTITAQQGGTQDFALLLDAPWMGYTPAGMESTQLIDQVTAQTLTLTNFGSIPLEFNIGGVITDPVLLLHLDEALGSTTFYDYSGYENHGACSGNSCPQAGLPGILGTAITFDGDDYIIVPNAPELNPQDAISFSAWIYPYDWNTNRRILQKGDWDTQYIFGCNGGTGGTLELKLVGVGSLHATLPAPGAWHHVVGLYDGTIMQIWIDGQLSAETPASGQISTTSDPLHIGTKYAGAPASDYFHGLMDDVMVFDRALSADEVMALYTGALGDLPPWLSIEPSAGIVPSGSTTPIQVTFDSTGLEPDVYTTTFYISSNDPLNPLVQVPITMTVILSDTLITGLQASNDSPTTLGSPTTLTATITAGTNVTFAWNFGDGAFGSGAITAHTYTNPGVYTATVTASNSTSSDSADTRVVIQDVAIAGLQAGNDSPTLLGQATTFTAIITAGTNVTFAWDFGDGVFGSGSVVTHTYAAPGIYTATVTATNSLNSVSATTQVQINAPTWITYLPMVQRGPLPPSGGGGWGLLGLGGAVCGIAGWKERRVQRR